MNRTTKVCSVSPKLSIVVPSYNEARGLPHLLERYAQAGVGFAFSLIVVDNGSRDDTSDVLARLLPEYPFARVVTIERNIGYGDGIAQGLRKADGEYVAWSHADMQTDPADVFRAFAVLQKSPRRQRTLVKGWRSGRAFSEQIITWGMQAVAMVLLRRWHPQINAQPKVFHRQLLRHLTHPPPDFNFDIYVLHQARRSGWAIKLIPVVFPPRHYGHSNWSRTWASKIRTIRGSIRFMARLGSGLWMDRPAAMHHDGLVRNQPRTGSMP